MSWRNKPDLLGTSTQNASALVLGHVGSGGALLVGNLLCTLGLDRVHLLARSDGVAADDDALAVLGRKLLVFLSADLGVLDEVKLRLVGLAETGIGVAAITRSAAVP